MSNLNKKNKIKKVNKKVDNKYDAENEIIIGVTTKPKEKVRVEKKATRTNKKVSKNNKEKVKTKKKQSTKQNIRSKKIKITTKNDIKKSNRRKIIVSIILLVLMIIGGTIYCFTTPMFNINDIVILGNNKNEKETYISLSRIVLGETNIFAISNNGIKKKMKENSYVEDATIKRKFPNTIEIYIKERVVAYQTEYLENYIYLDNQGYILEINEERLNVLTINGINLLKENVQVGKRVQNDDLVKLEVILKIANYWKYNNVEAELTSIDATDISNYILTLEKESKTVYFGNSSNLIEKMDSVVKIIKNEKGKKGEVFVNEDLIKRNRTYFREQV